MGFLHCRSDPHLLPPIQRLYVYATLVWSGRRASSLAIIICIVISTIFSYIIVSYNNIILSLLCEPRPWNLIFLCEYCTNRLSTTCVSFPQRIPWMVDLLHDTDRTKKRKTSIGWLHTHVPMYESMWCDVGNDDNIICFCLKFGPYMMRW